MSLRRVGEMGVGSSEIKHTTVQRTSGLPGPVQSLTATATGSTSINLSWSAPVINGITAITSHTVSVTPSAGSASVTGNAATISGLSAGTSYSFIVYAVNSLGAGAPSNSVSASTTSFNSATGGTPNDITNYNGTGQTWRTHTFTANGTLTVTSAPSTFRVFAVGGGGGGKNWVGSDSYGGGGGGGGLLDNSSATLAASSFSVVVGSGGTGDTINGGASSISTFSAGGGLAGTTFGRSGSSGTPQSNLGGFVATEPAYSLGGGGGGAGGAGGNANAGAGGAGGASLSNNASGTSVAYAPGGGGACCGSTVGTTGTARGSGGGGGTPGTTGRPGVAGIVIVAYRIA